MTMASSRALSSSDICTKNVYTCLIKLNLPFFLSYPFCSIVQVTYIIEHIKECQEHHEREIEKAFRAQK